MNESTFVIIKPDAVERGLVGKIITRIENTHLRFTGMKQCRKDAVWANRHYFHHSDKEWFPQLIEFMTLPFLIGFIVYGPNSIERLRNLVGSLDRPGTIRGDYESWPPRYNLIHASDSAENVTREMQLFYDSTTDNLGP